MKVLFSPSESKKLPTNTLPLSARIKSIYSVYETFLRQGSELQIAKAMGFKQIEGCLKILPSFLSPPLSQPAITLYDGVAYEALDYAGLNKATQDWLMKHTLIFSNLFGVVRAEENLPFYKLKQGEGFEGFTSQRIYQEQREQIDQMLQEEMIIDLRAEFYKKLYIPKEHCLEFEFFKNGKKVSHYAKYYRGIVLRNLAICNGEIEKVKENLQKEGLILFEVKNFKNRTIFCFSIPQALIKC